MVFHHIQKGYDQLIIINGDDLIYIFLDIGEQLFTRTLNSRTICNGIDLRKGYNFSLAQRFLHTAGSGRLNADYFDLWI